MQYGVGRQPCRCAQINSLLEVSHAVSMQSTVSRLLQLKIYRTSTRSRCTCTRVHVQYKTRYEVYIRVQYFMYSANKEKSISSTTKSVSAWYKDEDQRKAKIQRRTYHTWGGLAGGDNLLLLTSKGNTAVMGLGTLLAQWLRSSPDIQERAGSNPRAGKMKNSRQKK